MIKTHEGANAYEHALDHAVEFFSKVGSLFTKSNDFYEGKESALSLFQKTWIVDPETSFKLLLWLRDCRGGAGNRSGFRACLEWLATQNPEWITTNIGWIPLVGRWDDLRVLFGKPAGVEAAKLWAEALKKKDVLAAKWADRSDAPLWSFLKFSNEAQMRKFLSTIRKDHIVEYKMCSNKWGEIIYEHVPSVAMARYTKAFGKHDADRFEAYKAALEAGKTEINASVLFPHDCVRTVMYGDETIGDAQFEALPNYMDSNTRIIVLADTSGSMGCSVSGSIQAVHISQGMALYCSSKIDKKNPFYKKFIGFESEGSFKDWNGMKFSKAVKDRAIFDGACGSTHIGKALQLILRTAKFFNVTNDQMPTMLLIVSDMQFHATPGSYMGAVDDSSMAEIETHLTAWEHNGYSIPKIVYWNTSGYAGQPVTSKHNNVALVSGFSPAILKSILACDDLSPRGVMLKALEKYKIEVPK